MAKEGLIELYDLKKHFPLRTGLFDYFNKHKSRFLKAVDGISISINKGEIFGIAGESGCGKTTTAMLVAKLYEPTSGKILFEGMDITSLEGRELANYRKMCQMIFQDPYESLNPRATVFAQVSEALINLKIGSRKDRKSRVKSVLKQVDLNPEKYIDKFPHQMSGGERQRVSIACALVANPKLLIADEPTSMLDVSIKADILNIIRRLTKEMGVSVIYISHDLSILRNVCDKLAIMYLGRIVELGSIESIIEKPLHPYSKALLSAIPVPDPTIKWQAQRIPGEPPNPRDIPQGCRFHPRCPIKTETCCESEPVLKAIFDENKSQHRVACFNVWNAR